MSRSIRASSEALFGSASRGDADALSDRDILIVDDDTAILRKRAAVLTCEGWSVASYTFAKLDAIAAKGALFVQHLKLESEILEDHQGRLAKILGSYRPKSDYRQELAENSRLAAIAASVPSGGGGALLAADILYVAVRNFGVLRLAERGIHKYSFSSILSSLESEKLIGEQGKESLASLRFLKCIYRSGERTHGAHTVDVLNQALLKLPKGHFPASVRPKHPIAIIHDEMPVGTSAYLLLRDLERRFLALQAIESDCGAREELRQLKKWIENPRAYASFAATVAPQLRLSIQQSCTKILALARTSTQHAAIRI